MSIRSGAAGLGVMFLSIMMASAQFVSAEVPGLINCQGRVTVNGTAFTGNGEFQFALVDGVSGKALWSNGTASVFLPVDRGNYSVLLGDTQVAGMNGPVAPAVFAGPDVRLRVWFNDGVNGLQQLSPDQRFGAVPYAMNGGAASSSPAAGLVTVFNSLNATSFVVSVLQNAAGSNLTVAGFHAGAALTTGFEDALYGTDAGMNLKEGRYDTAFGSGALRSSINDHVNTAIGHYSMNALTNGSYNAAVGAGSMKQTLNGECNAALGANAMMSWTNGSDNVALGNDAMRTGYGNFNVAIGSGAGYVFSGDNNIFVGHGAGFNYANHASNNIVIGTLAGTTFSNGTGNIIMGQSAQASSANATNEVVFGSQLFPALNIYFGKGAINTAPCSYAIRGTASKVANVAGGDVRLIGGLGTTNVTGRGGAVSLESVPVGAAQNPVQGLVVVDGQVVMPNLPVSTNGFTRSGTLWNNNGVLSVWTK